MTDTEKKSSTTFKALSVVAILWNLMGVLAFAAQMAMPAEAMEKLPQEQQDLYANIPIWATVAFATAVFGGLAGSVTLLMRKSIAVPLLVLSLIGVLVQQAHMYLLSDTMKVMGPSAAIMPTVVLIIAVALIPFAKSATANAQ